MTSPRLPKWKTSWPNNRDLRRWLTAMFEKAMAIEDPYDRSRKASFVINIMAERVDRLKSLKWVERLYRSLPKDNALILIWALKPGAEICFDLDDETGMNRYLDRIAATAPLNLRKCDKGFSLGVVKKFKASRGILDPADADNEEQRHQTMHIGAMRRFYRAMQANQNTEAHAALNDLVRLLPRIKSDWDKEDVLRDILKGFMELGDGNNVKRWIKKLSAGERDEVCDRETLWGLGLKDDAIKRAEKDIRDGLKKLNSIDDPNVHFPASRIQRAVEFLFDHGEREKAERWLNRTFSESKAWDFTGYGFAAAGLLHMFAAITAKVFGPEKAQGLLRQAMGQANEETRTGWKAGAVAENLDIQAKLGNLDEAISRARKLRSKTERRENLARLLAQARRWKELKEVVSEAETPLEATELCWTVIFELPGGRA